MPSLEHNNQVKGESLDLVKYIDSNFEGPSLLPDVRHVLDCDPCNAPSSSAGSLMSEFSSQDPAKKQFAEELLAFTDAFNKALYSSIISKEDVSEETGNRIVRVFDLFENVCMLYNMLIFTCGFLIPVAALDKIEEALGKFNDGPFFLGQFSLVCD